MPAAIADRSTDRKGRSLYALAIAAGAHIFAGCMVNRNLLGYGAPASDTVNEKFVGLSRHNLDNTGGVNGALTNEGFTDDSFEMAASGMTQADVLEDAYVVDDQTVGLGIASQPALITGVVVRRTSRTLGGVSSFVYVSVGTLLGYGGGAAVNVSAGGMFILTGADGGSVLVDVTPGALPGSDQAENITVRHVRVGKIVEVVSATSVFVQPIN